MAVSSVSINSGGASFTPAQDGATQRQPLASSLRDAGASPRLSAFGRTKLSLDDLKSAAEAIRNLDNPPTFSDFKIAVQGFVQSLNALNKTVGDAGSGRSPDFLPLADARPAQALSEVRKAVVGPAVSAPPAWQKLGISAQEDGSYTLNPRQLEKSFQDNRSNVFFTLFDAAGRVGEAAGNPFAGKKPAVSETGKLQTGRGSSQSNSRERPENQRNFQQLLAAQLANAGSYVARNAVATYFSVAAL